MSERVAVLEPPRYLAPIEHIVGLEFFSDRSKEAAAHADPARLPPEAVQARTGLYVAGLRLLATVRAQADLSKEALSDMKPKQLKIVRRTHKDAIGEIRGELMTLDIGLETAAVRALRLALAKLSEKSPHAPKRRVGPRPKERHVDVLPAHLIPIKAGSKIVKIETGNLQNRIWPSGQPPRKLQLPGTRPQACCTWEELREIAEGEDLHGRIRGLRSGVEIDWDRLPKEDEPDEGEHKPKHDYARELQRQFMTGHQPTEADGAQHESLPVAKLHYVSLDGLRALMGGGYKFAEEYAKRHNFTLLTCRRRDLNRLAEYLRMEEAAVIWKAYEKIPVAEDDDIIIAAILRKAGITVTQSVRYHLTDEEAIHVRKKRALHPKGRVLEHLPGWLGERLVGRLRDVTLPPHLLPLRCIPNLRQMDLREVRASRQQMSLRQTKLRLEGGLRNLPQVCYDWSDIRKLVGNQETRVPIDFDALPRGPNETDPQRIAYARQLQAQLVPQAMRVNFDKPLPEPAIPATVPLLPIISSEIPGLEEAQEEAPAEADEQVIAPPSAPVWRPGQATKDPWLKPSVNPVNRHYSTRHPLDATAGLPEQVAPKLQHPPEVPGNWRPAERSGNGFISMTEHLSAPQIASELGVRLEAVDAVIAHLGASGQTSGQNPGAPIYHGQELLLIREQLVGVPLGYMSRIYKLTAEEDLQRLARALKRRGYEVFDGTEPVDVSGSKIPDLQGCYVSPGGFKEACEILTTTLLSSEKSDA